MIRSYKKVLISLFILASFILQFFTTFRIYTYLPTVYPPAENLELQRFRPPALWPFLTYPMYKDPHYEGSEIITYRVYATFTDSTELEVLSEDLGIGFFKFRNNFVSAIQNRRHGIIQDYASLIQEEHEQRPVSLRLEEHPLILRDGSLEKGLPKTITTIQFTSVTSQ